jgi:hypothetical protein
LFVLKGISSFVRVEARWYLLLGYAILPIFDLSLGYCQIKLSPMDNLDELAFLEYLEKIVIEPIDDILIFSMFEDIHIGHLALMLENL